MVYEVEFPKMQNDAKGIYTEFFLNTFQEIS